MKQLSRSEIDHLTVELELHLAAPIRASRTPHGKPFANREEGRQRRNARKAKQAARMAWLNS